MSFHSQQQDVFIKIKFGIVNRHSPFATHTEGEKTAFRLLGVKCKIFTPHGLLGLDDAVFTDHFGCTAAHNLGGGFIVDRDRVSLAVFEFKIVVPLSTASPGIMLKAVPA